MLPLKLTFHGNVLESPDGHQIWTDWPGPLLPKGAQVWIDPKNEEDAVFAVVGEHLAMPPGNEYNPAGYVEMELNFFDEDKDGMNGVLFAQGLLANGWSVKPGS